jgi:hypothetical protein
MISFTTKILARQSRNQSNNQYFIAEAQIPQSSEHFLIKKFFSLRPLRLRGEISS